MQAVKSRRWCEPQGKRRKGNRLFLAPDVNQLAIDLAASRKRKLAAKSDRPSLARAKLKREAGD